MTRGTLFKGHNTLGVSHTESSIRERLPVGVNNALSFRRILLSNFN